MTLTSRRAIRTQFRTIDGLSIRFSESEEREDHALLLSDAGHFFWEDAADPFAALLTRWWGGGYTAA
jgi:hypothetical protein